MPKMRRQAFLCHLLACLLLAASGLTHFTANAQAIQSVHFKLRTLHAIPMPHSGHGKPSWVGEKRTRKNPSGPNPVGNHRPPSRP